MGAEMRKSDGVRVCDGLACISNEQGTYTGFVLEFSRRCTLQNSELQNTRAERPAIHRTRHLGLIEQKLSTSSVNATEDDLPLERYTPRWRSGRRQGSGGGSGGEVDRNFLPSLYTTIANPVKSAHVLLTRM